MLKSKETFSLSSEFTIDNLREKLSSFTLQRQSLIVEKTDKLFIGMVDDTGFRVIGSNSIESLCIVKGQFEEVNAWTEIQIETSLHKAYLILFTVWFVVLGLVIIGFLVKRGELSSLLIQFGFLLIGTVFFRLLLHFGYQAAKSNTIKKIEEFL